MSAPSLACFSDSDAAPLEVDVDVLDQQLLADVDDLLGDLDVPLGELGDVHQALDAVLNAGPVQAVHRHLDHAGHRADAARAGGGDDPDG